MAAAAQDVQAEEGEPDPLRDTDDKMDVDENQDEAAGDAEEKEEEESQTAE